MSLLTDNFLACRFDAEGCRFQNEQSGSRVLFLSCPDDMNSSSPLLHVVLYQPEIPPNTGNIGRSCVAVGAKLWLVRPLGFQLEDRYLKRAGMDYWDLLDYEAVDDWAQLMERIGEKDNQPRTFWLLTKFARKLVWEAQFQPGDVLVFGSESKGLPELLRQEHEETCIRFPMRSEVRSLNLASTANAVIYEAVRQFGGLEA